MEAIWTPQPNPLMMSRPEYEALYGGAAGSGKTDYLVKDNVPVWGKFEYINGRWYAFDNAGFMIKRWLKTDEGWYYLGKDGGMLSGQWLQEKGKWYYLTKTGLMVTSARVKKAKGDGFDYVGADGVYNPIKSFIMGADNRVEIVE